MFAAKVKLVHPVLKRLPKPSALQLLQVNQIIRNGCQCYGTNVVYREARMLKKMMTGSNRSRKKFFTVDQPISKSLTEFGAMSKGVSRGTPIKSNKCIRRVEVLNNLFMQQISSLMSTGEVAPQLTGLGITISKVKVANDFARVNVFWIATGTASDNIIEPLLEKAGFSLRHELTQLRVIGMVPPIEFIKDKTYSKAIEVQTLLDKCDFGDDYVPTSSKNLFSQNSQLSPISLSTNDDSIGDEENEMESKEIIEESDLYKYVPFRQDMLGLRHDVISAEIKEAVKKLRHKKNALKVDNALIQDSNEEDSQAEMFSLKTSAEIAQELASENQRKEDFLKYLRKRSVSKAKELKLNSTYVKEKDFYDDEAYQRWKESVFGASFDEHFEDIDHFDEEFDDKFYSSRY